jgi:hypothetical protein
MVDGPVYNFNSIRDPPAGHFGWPTRSGDGRFRGSLLAAAGGCALGLVFLGFVFYDRELDFLFYGIDAVY